MDLFDWLDAVSVHEPGMWDNDVGPKGWYAVSTPDDSIIAYFQSSSDAYRYRLDYINRKMNP